MKAGARWYSTGSAITWETLGGSGVGPAVIRYCLMKGLGVIGLKIRFGEGESSLAAVSPPLDLALERVLEVLRRDTAGRQRDPGDRRHDGQAEADPADRHRRARLALAPGPAGPDGQAK